MKHFRPRLSRRAFWVLCALLVCLRLALTGFQQAYIWVGGAPLDDELMFRAPLSCIMWAAAAISLSFVSLTPVISLSSWLFGLMRNGL